MTHSYKMSKTGKSIETESKLVAARGLGEKKMEMTANGYEISFGGDKIVLELETSVDCTIF